MEYLIGIAVIVLIFYLLSRQSTASQPKLRPEAGHKREVDDDLGWLHERWKLADAHQQSGRENIFPKWYFDNVTERQEDRLKDLGIETGREVTKGQASDLIGIHEPAEERCLAILKFFKRSTKGMNQTKARHEVAQIMSEPDKVAAWESRPSTQEQKEFFKFFGLKSGRGLTAPDAEKIIAQHESELAEAEDPRLDEWEAFSEILEELADSKMRAAYDIKKPSAALVKSALSELEKEGKSYRDVADEIDLLVDKLVALKPELQRD